MIRFTTVLLLVCLSFLTALAQGKGVDKTTERVRDAGTAGSNGVHTSTGTGRGIDFGAGKTVVPPPLPNPYRFTARRDVILKAVADLMRDRKLIVDDAASRPEEGVIVSQPYTFIKGAVVLAGRVGSLRCNNYFYRPRLDPRQVYQSSRCSQSTATAQISR